jgi:hypothetical protein
MPKINQHKAAVQLRTIQQQHAIALPQVDRAIAALHAALSVIGELECGHKLRVTLDGLVETRRCVERNSKG